MVNIWKMEVLLLQILTAMLLRECLCVHSRLASNPEPISEVSSAAQTETSHVFSISVNIEENFEL